MLIEIQDVMDGGVYPSPDPALPFLLRSYKADLWDPEKMGLEDRRDTKKTALVQVEFEASGQGVCGTEAQTETGFRGGSGGWRWLFRPSCE